MGNMGIFPTVDEVSSKKQLGYIKASDSRPQWDGILLYFFAQ